MANQDNTDDFDVTYSKLGKYTLELFPEGYILLQKELAEGYHPTLWNLLNQQPADEIDTRLAVIAHHCKVVLDGTYTLEDRAKLCAVLAGRLEVLREIKH